MRNIFLSIIIPTRNRAASLGATLDGLVPGCFGENGIELLVIDNGSTDNTQELVKTFAATAPFPVYCHLAPCPGLHVGRNLGGELAQGEILAYLDDDVIVQPGWARAIRRVFTRNPAIALAGGPVRPLWEQEPPAWITAFGNPLKNGGGTEMGVLSLIDLGANPHKLSGRWIFGCNFIVRKHIFLDLSGFHPDGMPNSLLQYRGDGETALGEAVDSIPGMYAFYDPDIAVSHCIPITRLTREYLRYVAIRSGYSNAFTIFRQLRPRGLLRRLWLLASELYKLLPLLLKQFRLKLADMAHGRKIDANRLTPAAWQVAYRSARLLHLARISFSPALAGWVCQKSYFAKDPCPYYPALKE